MSTATIISIPIEESIIRIGSTILVIEKACLTEIGPFENDMARGLKSVHGLEKTFVVAQNPVKL